MTGLLFFGFASPDGKGIAFKQRLPDPRRGMLRYRRKGGGRCVLVLALIKGMDGMLRYWSLPDPGLALTKGKKGGHCYVELQYMIGHEQQVTYI